jgi:hypothetical protein
MSFCAYCGFDTPSPDVLCAHHTCAVGNDWATGNRIMCDFIHRRIVAPAPTAAAVIEWAS